MDFPDGASEMIPGAAHFDNELGRFGGPPLEEDDGSQSMGRGRQRATWHVQPQIQMPVQYQNPLFMSN